MDSAMAPSAASGQQTTGLKIRIPARKDWPSNQPRKVAGGSRVQRAIQRTASVQEPGNHEQPRHEPLHPASSLQSLSSSAPLDPSPQEFPSSFQNSAAPVWALGFASPTQSFSSSVSSYGDASSFGGQRPYATTLASDDAMDVDMD
ncbi:hypothetical protein BD626DRAFT_516266 [Schizophyllum amplum]|uniref:Uncharacterized protein n=1 Tax=Schizophyllum amplum TaxID=97359 RepID=A0A550BWZ2_9AGAR|nr:hypothetical protein BD626DRAFT_516266 [Auriculariopsis ampla]